MSRNFKLSPIGLAMLAVSGIARAGGYYFRLPVPVPYARQTSDSSATSSTAPTASTTSSSNSGSGGTGSTAPTTSSGSGSGTGGCTGGSVTIQGSTSSAVEQTVSIPDNCTTVEVKMYSPGGTSGYAGKAGDTFGPHLYQNSGSSPVYIANNGSNIQKTDLTSAADGLSIITSGKPGVGGAGGNGGNGSELSFSLPVADYTGGSTSASSSITFTAYVPAPSSKYNGTNYTTAFMKSTSSYEGVLPGGSGSIGGAGGMAGGKAESEGQYFTFNGGGGSSNYNGLQGSQGLGGAAGAQGTYSSLPNAQGVTFTAGAGGLGGNGLNATSSQVVDGSPGKIVVSWN